MKSAFFLVALLAMLALLPALWLGWAIVARYDVPFICFTVPVVIDLAVMCWAFSRFEKP